MAERTCPIREAPPDVEAPPGAELSAYRPGTMRLVDTPSVFGRHSFRAMIEDIFD